jgi:hypothetical protein
MECDLPEVIAEMKAEFKRYEQALVSNDVATLNAIFHNDPRTIRYGGSENLYGYAEIATFRAARSPVGLARTLSRTVTLRGARGARPAAADWRRGASASYRPR